MTVEEFNKQPSVQEFHSIRKQFYLDADSLLVKFPDTRHSKMNHAEWFADYGVPWTHMVRGYYLKTENDEFIMIYWNDFEIPNITAAAFIYLFEHFTNIKWIGLGCHKGEVGTIWPPKLKVFRGDISSK